MKHDAFWINSVPIFLLRMLCWFMQQYKFNYIFLVHNWLNLCLMVADWHSFLSLSVSVIQLLMKFPWKHMLIFEFTGNCSYSLILKVLA